MDQLLERLPGDPFLESGEPSLFFRSNNHVDHLCTVAVWVDYRMLADVGACEYCPSSWMDGLTGQPRPSLALAASGTGWRKETECQRSAGWSLVRVRRFQRNSPIYAVEGGFDITSIDERLLQRMAIRRHHGTAFVEQPASSMPN